MSNQPLNPSQYISNIDDENDNLISRKKQMNNAAHNRTQKRPVPITDKVSQVLKTIYDNNDDDDDDSPLADFRPPPNPISAAQRSPTKQNQVEGMQNLGSFSDAAYSPDLGNQPSAVDKEKDIELKNLQTNYGDNLSNDQYYKKYIPNYSNSNSNSIMGQYQSSQTSNANATQNEVLIKKLNYMIHLLEEKQDERTNNVTEEVVLYSFLGIFIIFIVDSFSRVGKYVR